MNNNMESVIAAYVEVYMDLFNSRHDYEDGVLDQSFEFLRNRMCELVAFWGYSEEPIKAVPELYASLDLDQWKTMAGRSTIVE